MVDIDALPEVFSFFFKFLQHFVVLQIPSFSVFLHGLEKGQRA